MSKAPLLTVADERHEKLVTRVIDAIRQVVMDMRVDLAVTNRSLERIRDEVEMLLDDDDEY